MSTYLTHLVQTPSTLGRLIAKPEDRRASLEPLFTALGGKLLGYWYGLGGTEVFVLSELPDDVAYSGLVAKVTASGAFASVTSTQLLTVEEMLAALRGSGTADYRAPGAAG